MRRVMVTAAVMALLASVMGGTAQAAKPTTGGDGVNPHIITDAFSLGVYTFNGTNGDIGLFWKVAGLGKYGSGILSVRGAVDIYVECSYRNNRTTERIRTVRINERPIYGDRSGNASDISYLHPNAVCTRNGTVNGAYGRWDGLGVDLYSTVDHSLIQEADITGCYNFTFGALIGTVPSEIYC